MPPDLFFFSQDCFGHSVSFVVSYELQDIFSKYEKIEIFDKRFSEAVDHFC